MAKHVFWTKMVNSPEKRSVS